MIAGRVLHISNSSFYGFSRQIDSLREACIILGQRTLQSLIYTLAVLDQYQNSEKVGPSSLNYREVWKYSLYTACLAQAIEKSDSKDIPSVFITFLFQGLGLILLDHYESELLEQSIQMAKESDIPLEKATAQVTGTSYLDLSRQALNFWRFPEDVCSNLKQISEEDNHAVVPLMKLSAVVAYAMGHPLVNMVFPKAISQQELSGVMPEKEKLTVCIEDAEILFSQMSKELLG